MKTSVITPVWNRSALTHSFLFQNWRLYQGQAVEFVISDNGSTDNTYAVLDTWQDKMGKQLNVISNPRNEGFPIACNQGARAAVGDVLLFLNNDVVIGGDYIAPILAALEMYPYALVGAEVLGFDTGWNKFGELVIPYVPGWCVACTRQKFDDVGGFDEQYSPCDYEDIDFSYGAKTYLHAVKLPIRHLSGQSGTQMPNRRAITERNRVKFAEKWGLV